MYWSKNMRQTAGHINKTWHTVDLFIRLKWTDDDGERMAYHWHINFRDETNERSNGWMNVQSKGSLCFTLEFYRMRWSKKHHIVEISDTKESWEEGAQKGAIRKFAHHVGWLHASRIAKARARDHIKCNLIGSNMKQRMNQPKYFNLYLAFFIFTLINLLKCAIYIRSGFCSFAGKCDDYLIKEYYLVKKESLCRISRFSRAIHVRPPLLLPL